MLQEKPLKKMHKKNKKGIAEQLVISFFFVSIIYLIIHVAYSDIIYNALNIINMVTIEQKDITYPSVTFDDVTKRLIDYPLWNTEFGTISISSVNINLPVYQGDSLDILKYGIGHFSGSLFPGEGGSIIFAGHNTKSFLYHLPEVKIGDQIIVTTTYGKFTYKIYETKVIDATDNDAFPFYKDREVLMIYTCFPVNTIGHKTHRFVVYAEKIGEVYEK
ncbi:MAG: sortase [Bacilli bacterium]|nr:sortase [Bacilli bacterium]